ncbi:MAG: response regulator [Chloroflexi bacterium]|nr:response regulator [Chloroflexota bacterium]
MNNTSQRNSPAQILVVDDSLVMRILVQETLLKTGFQVLTAANGMEAWELLHREPVHLVIADLSMTDLDGLELTRLIRAHKQFGALPVILMSVMDIGDQRQRGLSNGANAFVMKDRRDIESLANRINELLPEGLRVTLPDQPPDNPPGKVTTFLDR